MSRRFLTILAVFAMAVALLSPAGAGAAQQEGSELGGIEKASVPESPTGSYVVVMAADPLVVAHGRDGLDTPAARTDRQRLRESHDRAIREVGESTEVRVHDYTNALNGFSAIIPHEVAVELAARPDVALVVPDVMRQPLTDSSPDFIGLTGGGGAWAQGIDGEGVVVGVIDTGIWPEHPSFADDGSYAPAPVPPGIPCEFGNTAHNPDDAAFTCNDKLVGARQMLATYRELIGADPDEYDSARDDDGHGTHTASTAAGNAEVTASILGRERGVISGIAPRAHVIAYKGLGNQGGFSSDLAAAIDQAVADGVDVINYSIGGGASLTGADDIAFLFASDAGLFVATSAGNSGPGPGTVGGPGNVPWLTTVGANTQERFFTGRIVLGDGRTYEGASITLGTGFAPLVDAADAGGDLCVPGELDAAVVTGAIVLCRRGVIGRVEKSLAVFEAGGVGMIMYENTDDNNLFSDTHWVPSVHIDNTPGLEIKEYIASDSDPTARLRPLRNTSWPSAPSMTNFSSRGPNVIGADIIKPDITAPGLQILAGNSPTPNPGSVPGELFQAIAGTSMSSPHIAGVLALVKQAHPDWSAAAAKSALMTTADQEVVDNDRVTPAGPFAMGSGHVDTGNPNRPGSAFQPGLVYDAGFNDYLGFLCDAAPEIFVDPIATCELLASLGFPTDASDLNYPSIGVVDLAGSQTVTRTVTSVAGRRATYDVSVDAPPGFDVTVTPDRFTIDPGESVTYQVTFTNDGTATIGEWQAGSITWKSDRYEVYSPIALNASLFDAPDEVVGTGVDGSVSFDVKFGYTGDYTAAGHGLEPATVTSDTVVQDPDQNFDPADGFSDAHEFTLSGAAHFRVAIPPEATEPEADLDVYVFDPNGDLVASSTLGGTDELVDISTPADGTWTVYVHGWQTIGGDSDYDMYSWVISATPGGSLVIDAAPDAAVLGETATIEASWTGAVDAWYLGGVSHSDANGLIGLTLVNVDNRP